MISSHQLYFRSLHNPEKLFKMLYETNEGAKTTIEREEKSFIFGRFTKAYFGSLTVFEACSLQLTHVVEHYSWAYKSNNMKLFCHSFAIPVCD